jgi:hypothetical protein
MTNRAPEESTSVTIEKKWTWVIHALRRAFPELESSRIFALAKDACARLKWDIRKGDICRPVQLGEQIEITDPRKPETLWVIDTLTGFEWLKWFVKYTDPSGKVTYTLNGREMPQAPKRT